MLTLKSCDVKRLAYPRPALRNGIYLHYKGGTYEVYGLSQQESTGIWDVLYRNPRSGEPFHRPHLEWMHSVNSVPRFVYLGSSMAEANLALEARKVARNCNEASS